MKVALRPESKGDEAFLFNLYASTREDLAFLEEPQRSALLMVQFAAKKRHYDVNFPEARREIVLLGDKPIGKLTTVKTEQEIRLADIALLPEYRNMGIGSRMIRDMLDFADREGLPVELHVSRQNRAMCLYRRLGFSVKETDEVSCLMERPPGI